MLSMNVICDIIYHIKKLIGRIKDRYSLLKKNKHKKWDKFKYSDFSNIKWPLHPAAKKMIRKSAA